MIAIEQFTASVLWTIVMIVVLAIAVAIYAFERIEQARDVAAGMRKVVVLKYNGTIEPGVAFPVQCLDGWQVFTKNRVLSAFGKNGTFPNGNPLGWVKWGFEEGKEP